MCLQEILEIIDGPIQIWNKVPAELEMWYFVLASGTHTLERISKIW